jgi:multiple sugar transport system ATP-binding protein
MVVIDGVVEEIRGRRRFVGTAMSVDLPDAHAAAPLGPARLGLRPEDIVVSKEQTAEDVVATVYTREPLGADLYLTLELGGVLLRARASADLSVDQGDSVGLRFRTDRMHLFDAVSGRTIATDRVPAT